MNQGRKRNTAGIVLAIILFLNPAIMTALALKGSQFKIWYDPYSIARAWWYLIPLPDKILFSLGSASAILLLQARRSLWILAVLLCLGSLLLNTYLGFIRINAVSVRDGSVMLSCFALVFVIAVLIRFTKFPYVERRESLFGGIQLRKPYGAETQVDLLTGRFMDLSITGCLVKIDSPQSYSDGQQVSLKWNGLELNAKVVSFKAGELRLKFVKPTPQQKAEIRRIFASLEHKN